MKDFVTIFILCLVLIPNYLIAQNEFVSIGGDITSEKGNLSFSVGQTAYQFILGTEGNINQGVQQPYEIYVITAADDLALIDFECNAFPNPTNNLLTLSIKNKAPYGLSYQLVNSTGSLLSQNDLVGEETTLSMRNYTPAVYFLRLIEDEKIIRTFKIIKH